MIGLSCHSENFGISSPEDTFCFISRLGFRFIDVAARSIVPQEAILADPGKQAALLRELSAKYELTLDELFLGTVETGGPGVFSAGDSSAFSVESSETYRRFAVICGFSKSAGFSSVMGNAGSEIPALGYERSFERAAEAHRKMLEIAADNGIAYYVEPSRISLCNTPARALEMVRAAPGLKYTLDFLHYQINSIPLEESLKLIPYAGHMHARQAAAGIGKCPVELGEIDYDTIVRKMAALNWSGNIAMEFWNGEEQNAAGINPVEQNIVMKYELRKLVKKYYGYMPK